MPKGGNTPPRYFSFSHFHQPLQVLYGITALSFLLQIAHFPFLEETPPEPFFSPSFSNGILEKPVHNKIYKKIYGEKERRYENAMIFLYCFVIVASFKYTSYT
jgi:hypothetical protein